MKVLCHREGLLSACQIASAAIPAKDLKPILKNLKAVAGDGRFTIIATDMEVGIRFDVRGLTIEEPGEAILPALKLTAILREARDAELSIDADASACVVKGAQLEFEMPSENPAQFPDFPHFNDEKYHEITAESLAVMIRRTIFAVAGKEDRYSLTGVMWELDGDRIKLVATDGRRLAMAEGTATGVGGHTTRGLTPVVPTKAMALLERSLQDAPDEPVKVCIRPNDVLFRTGRAVIYSKLVEGRFPDYRAVIPKKTPITVPLNPVQFQAAVRQAAIMTDTDSRRVAFKFDKGKLTLVAQGAMAGRSRIEMPLEFTAKAIDINFNPEYLVDMLKVLPPNAPLTVDLIDGASSALFRCEESYVYLVMPLT